MKTLVSSSSNLLKFSLKLLSLVVAVFIFTNSPIRDAYGVEGGGSDSGGVNANCSNNALQTLCGNPEGSAGGGASWRIFRVSENAYGLDDDTTYGGNILKEQYKGEALRECANSGWFASFGWDGMYGSHYGYPNFNFQIGPANRKPGNLISKPETQRNTYDTYDLNRLRNEGYPNNVRIDDNTALKLYQNLHPDLDAIPVERGYFCFSPYEFEGRSSVSNSLSNSANNKTTNWQHQDKAINFDFECSLPGCSARLWHEVRRLAGSSNSSASLRRTSNYFPTVEQQSFSERSVGFAANNLAKPFDESFENRLVPGQKLCEYMTFNTTSDGSRKATTGVCAIATGTVTTDSNILVKNNSIPKFNTFQREVYAKPGDSLSYQATYSPTLQYAYKIIPTFLREIRNVDNPGPFFLSQLFDWNNAFSIQRAKNQTTDFNNNNIDHTINYTDYINGDTETKTEDNQYNEVKNSDVGHSIDERTAMNINSSTRSTPTIISFDANNAAHVRADEEYPAIAHARVPYNFINETNIEDLDKNTVFYAGEKQTIPINIATLPRQNDVTEGYYATIVNNAKWRIRFQYTENGQEITQETNPDKYQYSSTGQLAPSDSSGYTEGYTSTKQIAITVPDVPAGTEICVQSGVYPENSGAPTNWSDSEGSHTWAWSQKRCFVVGKKPSLQILGGNVFSANPIITNFAAKAHLSGITPYSADYQAYSNTHVFGSWGELGIIADKGVSGFASGASTGYPLGSKELATPNFCKYRTPLTIANYPCSNDTTIGIGSTSSANHISSEKSSLIQKFISPTNNIASGEIDLSTPIEPQKESGIYHYGSSGNLIVSSSGPAISKGVTKVVRAQNITIASNLTSTNESLTDYSETPRLIIYAEKDISINCNVEQIDAVLVAEGTVDTCADVKMADTQNNEVRVQNEDTVKASYQLTIRGAVIASQFNPERTYGAATGSQSITPAEVINFDPTLYLFGINQTTKITDNASKNYNLTLQTVHQTELAPRY